MNRNCSWTTGAGADGAGRRAAPAAAGDSRGRKGRGAAGNSRGSSISIQHGDNGVNNRTIITFSCIRTFLSIFRYVSRSPWLAAGNHIFKPQVLTSVSHYIVALIGSSLATSFAAPWINWNRLSRNIIYLTVEKNETSDIYKDIYRHIYQTYIRYI